MGIPNTTRLEKLEQKARITRRPDPIDPLPWPGRGELSKADCRYLAGYFRDAGFNLRSRRA